MTMTKYSTDPSSLLLGMQNEEGQLMHRLASLMSDTLHQDDNQPEVQRIESRLHSLRYEIDQFHNQENKKE